MDETIGLGKIEIWERLGYRLGVTQGVGQTNTKAKAKKELMSIPYVEGARSVLLRESTTGWGLCICSKAKAKQSASIKYVPWASRICHP